MYVLLECKDTVETHREVILYSVFTLGDGTWVSMVGLV